MGRRQPNGERWGGFPKAWNMQAPAVVDLCEQGGRASVVMSFSSVRRLALATAAFFALSAGAALAGPCTGQAPEPGQSFRGPVLFVEDGERICVALGTTPDQWVPVVLADSPLQTISATGADPRGALMATAFAQNVTCTSLDRVAGEVLAACTLDDKPLGALMRQPAALTAGAAWR